MDIKYSVLMSVYEKENPEWFRKSIQSMLEQTVFPDEFVIVKDGKLPKELDEVIMNYSRLYPTLFQIVALDENVGLGPALQIGVEECSNEFIARMDSDDYSVPNRVETELKIISANDNLGIVGSNVFEFTGELNNIVSTVKLPEEHSEIISFSKKRNPFRHPSVLLRKSKVLEAGNYREYYLCEDYDMWVRMLRKGSKGYNIQKELVYMRIDEDFYRRRGGLKYFKSIHRFKKEQFSIGYFTLKDYIASTVPHFIISLSPNFVRDFVYRKFLRNK